MPPSAQQPNQEPRVVICDLRGAPAILMGGVIFASSSEEARDWLRDFPTEAEPALDK